jgi:hypothetical protein
VHWSVAGWLKFLTSHGVVFPEKSYRIFKLDLPVR